MAAPYISEISFRGKDNTDFIEIVVDAGTDVSQMFVTIYDKHGEVESVVSLGSLVTTMNGKDIYVIDKATTPGFDGIGKKDAVAFENNGTVLQFLSFKKEVTAEEGVADGMTSTALGKTGKDESFQSTDGGATYTDVDPNPGTIPCFVDGTMILTPDGERPVEDLLVGDLVITRDKGAQALRWIGHTEPDIHDSAETMPVRITAHAFGHGLPARDLWVSPYHRLVVEDPRYQLLFDSREMLVPATHMQNGNSIQQSSRGRAFSYYHLLFDQHEVIFSDGLATESFHPRETAVDAFSDATWAEVVALFPELANADNAYGPTVRPVVSPHEAGLVNPVRLQ